jgi:hypothetical protein
VVVALTKAISKISSPSSLNHLVSPAFEGSTTVEDETIVRFGQPIQTRYFTDLTFPGTSQIPQRGTQWITFQRAFRGDNLAVYC